MSGLIWEQARPATGWQGIDHLQLSELGGMPLLTLRLLGPVGSLGAGQIEIPGAPPWSIVPEPVLPPPAPAPALYRRLRIRFHQPGDHARYTVRLLSGGGLPLHPFFQTRTFRFRIGCESRDCAATEATPTLPTISDPALDGLARDSRALEALLLDRLSRSTPDLQDLALATTERMLVQLLAFQGDLLAYHQDRVASEAFPETATQRHSLRQHAILLGESLDDGQAARCWLEVAVTRAGVLPAGMPVESPQHSPGQARLRFSTLADTELDPEPLRVAAWPGALDAFLPAGTTQTLLLGNPSVQIGQKLAFVLPEGAWMVTVTGVDRQIAPGWTAHPHDPLLTTPQAVTRLHWDRPLPRRILVWKEPFRLAHNLVQAEHGQECRLWLRPPQPPPVPDRVVDLRGPDVVLQQPAWAEEPLLRALRLPGPVLVAEEGARVWLESGGETWYAVEHLHQSSSFDPHFVAETTESGDLWLKFGDGRKGKALRSDLPARIRWRVGAPLAGNCPAGVLSERLSHPDPELEARVNALGVLQISNLSPGEGGRSPLPRAALQQRLADSLHQPSAQRAVSLLDLAVAAQAVPGVARAAARLVHAPFPSLRVLIDPVDPQAGEELEVQVQAALEPLRLAGRELWVQRARSQPVELVLAVCPQPGQSAAALRRRVEAALVAETGGYFHPDRLDFGVSLHLGDLLAAVQAMEGVRACRALVFRKLGRSQPAVQWTLPVGRGEVLRLDGDPLHPENGRINVLVMESA